MRRTHFLYRIFDLYYDGMRNMKLGKTLWTIVVIKLAIIFFIMKIFFFPDFLKNNAPEGKEADYVAGEFENRALPPDKKKGESVKEQRHDSPILSTKEAMR